jgi:hypothetical protein
MIRLFLVVEQLQTVYSRLYDCIAVWFRPNLVFASIEREQGRNGGRLAAQTNRHTYQMYARTKSIEKQGIGHEHAPIQIVRNGN